MTNSTNNTNLSIDEKIFDALLKLATEEAMKEEMEALPDNEELNRIHMPSETLNKKISSIITKEKRMRKRKNFAYKFAKIAAVFIVALSVSGVILMSIEASRNFILNAFISVQNNHVAFYFESEESEGNEEINIDVISRYIPDDFKIVNIHNTEMSAVIIYEGFSEQRIIIRQDVAINLQAAIDNEERNFSSMRMGGQEVFVFAAEDISELSIIMWQNRNGIFTVHSDIDFEMLLSMVERMFLN